MSTDKCILCVRTSVYHFTQHVPWYVNSVLMKITLFYWWEIILVLFTIFVRIVYWANKWWGRRKFIKNIMHMSCLINLFLNAINFNKKTFFLCVHVTFYYVSFVVISVSVISVSSLIFLQNSTYCLLNAILSHVD